MSDSHQRTEGKQPPIDAKKTGMPPEAIAACEADLEHIGLAAEQKKQKETDPVPRPVNEEVIKHIFGNLASVHEYQHVEAAVKGPKITVPLPRFEGFLARRQQYPMDPPSNVGSDSGAVGASAGKGKGKAVDEEKK